MMQTAKWIVVVLVGMALPCSVFAEGKRKKFAVMEFASKGGISKDRAEALGDLVANTIRGYGKYDVIAKADIKTMLGMAKAKEALGCDDESCLAEIGGALGVEYVVAGNLSLMGKTYLLNLKVIDQRKVW